MTASSLFSYILVDKSKGHDRPDPYNPEAPLIDPPSAPLPPPTPRECQRCGKTIPIHEKQCVCICGPPGGFFLDASEVCPCFLRCHAHVCCDAYD